MRLTSRYSTEERNIAAALLGALRNCDDVYTRARLARRVVLFGGGCSLPGFAARLVCVRVLFAPLRPRAHPSQSTTTTTRANKKSPLLPLPRNSHRYARRTHRSSGWQTSCALCRRRSRPRSRRGWARPCLRVEGRCRGKGVVWCVWMGKSIGRVQGRWTIRRALR